MTITNGKYYYKIFPLFTNIFRVVKFVTKKNNVNVKYLIDRIHFVAVHISSKKKINVM